MQKYINWQKNTFVSAYDKQDSGCQVNGQVYLNEKWIDVTHEFVPLNINLGWIFNLYYWDLFRLFDIPFSFEHRIEKARNRVNKNIDKWIKNEQQKLTNIQKIAKVAVAFKE